MDAPVEKILFFTVLSADEQAEVRAFVDENPSWKPILNQAAAMADLLQAAQGATAAQPTTDMLAHLIAAEHLLIRPLPAEMVEAQDRAEEKLATNAAYRETYEALAARLRALTSGTDPAAQFERLAGHSAKAVVDPHANDEGREHRTNDRPAARGSRVPSTRMPQFLRLSIAIAATVLVLYAMLWGISEMTTPTHERLAAIDADELYVEGFGATRSSPNEATAADAPPGADVLYLEALEHLRYARSDVLGLFPRYDQEALSKAETRLRSVIDAEEAGSFVQLDAYYFLGKIHLARGEEEEARVAFLRVVRGEGRNAPSASGILQELAADDAYDPEAN